MSELNKRPASDNVKQSENNPISQLIVKYKIEIDYLRNIRNIPNEVRLQNLGTIEILKEVINDLVELKKNRFFIPSCENSTFGELQAVDFAEKTITLSFGNTEPFVYGIYEVSRVVNALNK